MVQALSQPSSSRSVGRRCDGSEAGSFLNLDIASRSSIQDQLLKYSYAEYCVKVRLFGVSCP
jgi:hypothetical protein